MLLCYEVYLFGSMKNNNNNNNNILQTVHSLQSQTTPSANIVMAIILYYLGDVLSYCNIISFWKLQEITFWNNTLSSHSGKSISKLVQAREWSSTCNLDLSVGQGFFSTRQG